MSISNDYEQRNRVEESTPILNFFGSVWDELTSLVNRIQEFASELIGGEATVDSGEIGEQHGELSIAQPNRIASIFDLQITQETATELCFERAYLACKSSDWHLIEPVHEELSLLVNRVGHTLLIRALVRDDISVAEGLINREIATFTTDPLGNLPLLYAISDSTVCTSLLMEKLSLSVEATPPNDRLAQINIQRELAQKAHQTGDFTEAIKLYNEVLSRFKEQFGEGHPGFASLLFEIGNLHKALKDFSSATECYERALTLRKELFGEEHPEVIRTLLMMANVFMELPNQDVVAREYFRQTLELTVRTQNEDHSTVQLCLCALGTLYGEDHSASVGVERTTQPLLEDEKFFCEDPNKSADRQLRTAACYSQLNKGKKSIELALLALQIKEDLFGDSHIELVNGLKILGIAYLREQNFEEAEKCFLRAERLMIETYGENSLALANMYTELGEAYKLAHKCSVSIKYHEKTLAIFRASPGIETAKLLDALLSLGNAYLELLEQSPKAKECFDEALKLSTSTDENFLPTCLTNMGGMHRSTGDFITAAKNYERSVQEHELLPDDVKATGESRRHFSDLQFQLALCYYRLGEWEKGYQSAKVVLRIQTEIYGPDHVGLAMTLLTIGRGHLHRWAFSDAKICFSDAAVLIEKAHGKGNRFAADLYEQQGVAYLEVGEYAEALKVNLLALEIYRNSPSDFRICRVLRRLGELCQATGNLAHAEAYFVESLSILDSSVDEKKELYTVELLRSMVVFYQQIEANEKAVRLANRGLELVRTSWGHEHPLVADFAVLLSQLSKQETLQESKIHLLEAKRLAEKNGDLMQLARISSSLASLLEAQGEIEEALENYEKASLILEDSGAANLYGQHLITLGLFYDRSEGFEKAVICLNRAIELLGETEPLQFAKALAALGYIYCRQGEHSQASELLKGAADICKSAFENQPTDEWKISMLASIYQVYQLIEISVLMRGTTDGALRALEISDSRRAQSLVALIRNQIQQAGGEVAPRDLGELTKALNATIILLSCSQLDQNVIYIWIISPSGAWNFLSVPATGITESCKIALSTLSFPLKSGESSSLTSALSKTASDLGEKVSNKGGPLTADLIQKRDRLRKKFNDQLKQWYQTLVAPIEDFLPEENGKLIFVPDQILSTLPFHLFCGPEGYLIKRYVVTTSPSIVTLDLLGRRRMATGVTTGALIVDDPKTKVGDLKTGGEESAKLTKLMDARVLSKEVATVEQTLSHMSTVSTIHFSCHGSATLKTHPDSVCQGGLFLSPDETHLNGELLAAEIVNTTIRADLVFMSACSTGLGGMEKDGVIGLVRAFLASGASSVIAALWKVADSDLTVKMIEHFYDCLINKGLGKGSSLREAILLGMNEAPEDIEKWGVFALSGES